VSSSFVVSLPPEPGPAVGFTLTADGPAGMTVAAPPTSVLWKPDPVAALSSPPASSTTMTLDAGLTTDSVVVAALIQLRPYGVCLSVDGWLDVGLWGGASLAVTMAGVLNGQPVTVETPPDPLLAAGGWAVLRVIVSSDQLAVAVDHRIVARLPLARHFVVPTPVTAATLGVATGYPALVAAGLSMSGEVPSVLVSQLDLAESGGLGDVTGAYHRRGGKAVLGGETADEHKVPGGRFRTYEFASTYWTPRSGGVVLTGPVWEHYQVLGAHTGPLGFPLTDTQPGTARYATRTHAAPKALPLDASEMARFERGAIAWSALTDVHEVLDEIASHWLRIGGPRSVVGLPTGSRLESPHGWRHSFQFGDIFHDTRLGCAEVHGAILDRYDQLGAWDGVLGSPVADEADVLDEHRNPTGTRLSRFGNGAIYWSAARGALALEGDWLASYDASGGPTGPLGMPVGERTTKGAVEYVAFEHGVIVNGPGVAHRVVTQVDVKLSDAAAPDIDDGFEYNFPFDVSKDHDAELITWVTVRRDGVALPDWDGRRFPGSGRAGKSVSFGNQHVVLPVTADTTVGVAFSAEDWDAWPNGNDALGGVDRTYDIGTAWGELGAKGPTYVETGSGGDGDVIYSYSIGLATPPLAAEFRQDRWWEFVNKGTDDIGYDLYARAFDDVEAHHDWWDTVTNPLDHMFYELAVRSVAEGGNCFGMSSVAHRALFDTNAFRIPLSRPQYGGNQQPINDAAFPGWLRDELNIGQTRQLAASVVATLLAAVADLSLFNPIAVAARVKDRLDHGDLPLISFQASGFSKGHAVLCYATEARAGNPETLLLADPNVPFVKNADRHASRLEVDSTGAWRFYDNGNPDADYRSSAGAVFFDIPGDVVRAPTITPMAALDLGVNAVLGAFAIMGGDTHHEVVRPAGFASSLHPVPLHQSSSTTRFYGAPGPTPGGLTCVVVANSPTDARLYARTANQAVGVTLPLDRAGEYASFVLDRFDGGRPQLVATIDQDTTRAKVHLASLAGRAQRAGWLVNANVNLDRTMPFTIGMSTVGAGVELEGLAAGPAPTVELSGLDGTVVSSYALGAVAAGKRFELRPADMASPFGDQILSGPGPAVIVSPIP
jgi:hypothetical protein